MLSVVDNNKLYILRQCSAGKKTLISPEEVGNLKLCHRGKKKYLSDGWLRTGRKVG